MTGGTRALARASERATRLYAAENAASAAFPSRRYRTFAELRAHAEAIVCSDWWADTFPDAPIEVGVNEGALWYWQNENRGGLSECNFSALRSLSASPWP